MLLTNVSLIHCVQHSIIVTEQFDFACRQLRVIQRLLKCPRDCSGLGSEYKKLNTNTQLDSSTLRVSQLEIASKYVALHFTVLLANHIPSALVSLPEKIPKLNSLNVQHTH